MNDACILSTNCNVPQLPSFLARRKNGTLEVDIDSRELPYDGPFHCDWIWCGAVFPHADPRFEGSKFLTLTVRASFHLFGSVDTEPDERGTAGVCVPPGTLFIVDPMRVHWLFPEEYAYSSGTLPLWVGLQWTVETKKLKTAIRDVKKYLKGASA